MIALAVVSVDSGNNTLVTNTALATQAIRNTEKEVEAINIFTVETIKNFQDLDKETVRQLNVY